MATAAATSQLGPLDQEQGHARPPRSNSKTERTEKDKGRKEGHKTKKKEANPRKEGKEVEYVVFAWTQVMDPRQTDKTAFGPEALESRNQSLQAHKCSPFLSSQLPMDLGPDPISIREGSPRAKRGEEQKKGKTKLKKARRDQGERHRDTHRGRARRRVRLLIISIKVRCIATVGCSQGLVPPHVTNSVVVEERGGERDTTKGEELYHIHTHARALFGFW